MEDTMQKDTMSGFLVWLEQHPEEIQILLSV